MKYFAKNNRLNYWNTCNCSKKGRQTEPESDPGVMVRQEIKRGI